MILLKIALILAFVLFSAIAGAKEAILYHHRSSSISGDKTDWHPLFVIERGVVLGLIYLCCRDWILCSGLIFIFSIIHNGVYYESRHALNPSIYPYGWRSNSTTSTAFFEFDFPVRLILAGWGIIVIAFSFLL